MDSETNTNHRTNHVPDLPSLCRFIFNNSPLPVAMAVGAKHIVRYVNPAFCRLASKSKDELIGKRFAEISYHCSRPRRVVRSFPHKR